MPAPVNETPLRRAVRAADVSLRSLAAQVGMSPTAVHRRITGEVALNTDEIRAFAAALAVSPVDLLGTERERAAS